MKKIKYLSISQINLHKKNPRRWCLQYLEGIKTPTTRHLDFGHDVHAYLENKITKSQNKSENLSTTNKEFLDNWYNENSVWLDAQDWGIETEFTFWLDPHIPPIRGIIDMWAVEKGPKHNLLYLLDHKTTTKGYEETADSLLSNDQLMLYAYAILCRPSGGRSFDVIIGHNQFFKSRHMTITESKLIRANPTLLLIEARICGIIDECYAIMDTYETYKNGGLQAVPETPENEWWYGKRCELWPCIIGEESIEDCRKRMEDLCRKK